MSYKFNPLSGNFDDAGQSIGTLDTRYIKKGGDSTTGDYVFTGSDSGTDGMLLNPNLTNPSVSKNSLNVNATFNPTADTSQRMWALRFQVTSGTNKNFTSNLALTGFEGLASHQGTGTMASAVGGLAYSRILGAGVLTDAYGIIALGNGADTGAITTSYNIKINDGFKSNGGTITTQYGLKIDDQTVGSTNYAISTGLGQVHFYDTVNTDNDIVIGTQPYVYYGNYYQVEKGGNWPSGTHKLIGVTWNGSADQTDIFTPGGGRSTPMLSLTSDAKLSFFNHSVAAQGASGADLTNNVGASGTTDQIDDFTNLTVYATDAGAIHNDIYQLARKVKQINDALRAYGLLT